MCAVSGNWPIWLGWGRQCSWWALYGRCQAGLRRGTVSPAEVVEGLWTSSSMGVPCQGSPGRVPGGDSWALPGCRVTLAWGFSGMGTESLGHPVFAELTPPSLLRSGGPGTRSAHRNVRHCLFFFPAPGRHWGAFFDGRAERTGGPVA